MTGTFKANNPVNTFLLLIYGILLKLPMFLNPVEPVPQKTDGFLFRQLLLQLENVGAKLPAVYPLIAFALLYTQAITFNQMANNQRMIQKPNYLIGMSYLLITSLFKEWNVLSAPLFVTSLVIWVWSKMSSISNSKYATGDLFNIGMVVGLCTFFYFPSIAFAVLIIFGLVLIRPFALTEWLAALLGIIAPYYFLLSYLFLTDKWKGYKFPGISFSLPHFKESGWALAAIIIVLFVSAVGLFFIRLNFLRQLVQTRKSWNLVFLYFLVAVSIPFINESSSFSYWIMCAVPLSTFVACALFYPERDWFPKFMHFLMLAFVIAFSYFSHKFRG